MIDLEGAPAVRSAGSGHCKEGEKTSTPPGHGCPLYRGEGGGGVRCVWGVGGGRGAAGHRATAMVNRILCVHSDNWAPRRCPAWCYNNHTKWVCWRCRWWWFTVSRATLGRLPKETRRSAYWPLRALQCYVEQKLKVKVKLTAERPSNMLASLSDGSA